MACPWPCGSVKPGTVIVDGGSLRLSSPTKLVAFIVTLPISKHVPRPDREKDGQDEYICLTRQTPHQHSRQLGPQAGADDQSSVHERYVGRCRVPGTPGRPRPYSVNECMQRNVCFLQ